MSPKDFEIDADLIEALFLRYRKTMQRIANAIVKDVHEADDIVSLAMIKIMKNIGKIDNIDTDRCKHFIMVITKNTALSELSKKKNRKTVTFAPTEMVNIVGGNIDLHEFEGAYGFSEEITTLLAELKEGDKDILCLKYGDDYSDTEISEILEIKEDTVRKRLSRARKRLGEILEAERCARGL
ncbi:MAG: sigma-70 family RNA polymerase sigma factor [Clostridiales Family XIII bacterium]|uniref:RNA polymerase sigma factor n=1 Tax=Hominibacterium faecale TaxID=2839743 RepID=UPI001D127D50|nr:sigma-70 family RNA polymerase sigma factor [Hominibacterium faecale]MCC2865359.1 sigma-70 family RNA polymerase sigma factor [Anaerovorax odorimutans]MCI7303478.1 sigma-70 family RNA polymerase sigma factor [Clostridia bacterium]MDE8732902.1 sigma-70 family RNA polymerase sigma factor [Eubacteriales bacterium DFI.9.88]MDY3012045.1 sigma-70 family RNA polymerase sigma factor [Clostridiales Family XIII bacterium]